MPNTLVSTDCKILMSETGDGFIYANMRNVDVLSESIFDLAKAVS